LKTYRVVMNNPRGAFLEYQTTSFERALELFVEDGGDIERDLRHVEETLPLPRRASRGVADRFGGFYEGS